MKSNKKADTEILDFINLNLNRAVCTSDQIKWWWLDEKPVPIFLKESFFFFCETQDCSNVTAFILTRLYFCDFSLFPKLERRNPQYKIWVRWRTFKNTSVKNFKRSFDQWKICRNAWLVCCKACRPLLSNLMPNLKLSASIYIISSKWW